MDKKYVYRRLYFNTENEDDKRLLSYLEELAIRDKNKFIKEALKDYMDGNNYRKDLKQIKTETNNLNPEHIWKKYQ